MITPNQLEAVSLAMSTEETRYYLCGVCVETYKNGQVGIIATDGHRMHSFNAIKDEQPVSSFILSANDVEKLIKMAKMEAKQIAKLLRDKVTINLQADKASIMCDETQLFNCDIKPIDGNFPDWRRILPSGKVQANAISFNGAYLADFGKAAKLLGSSCQQFTITNTGAQNPALITLPYDAGFLGVLMPMRGF